MKEYLVTASVLKENGILMPEYVTTFAQSALDAGIKAHEHWQGKGYVAVEIESISRQHDIGL